VIGAALTAVFYGITPVCARGAIRLLGFVKANLLRLLVAVAAIGVMAFAFGRGFGDEYAMFAVAGAIGFGIGGLAMFRALPSLGAPLASLITETVAAFAAALLAWAWFSDGLTTAEILWCLVILAGVVVGLLPYVQGEARRAGARAGVALACLAAVAQGVSAVISRKALLSVQQTVATVPGEAPVKVGSSFDYVISAAFDRLTGGVLVAIVVFVAARWAVRRLSPSRRALTPVAVAVGARALVVEPPVPAGETPPRGPAWRWVGANALFGPILGVTCMVWALQSLQPGKAQAIAAVAPLISVPFARWLERHRPPAGYYLGAVIAIVGMIGLSLAG